MGLGAEDRRRLWQRLFGPENPITREQMAVILLRYMDAMKYVVTEEYRLFVDEAEISDFAKTRSRS